MEIRNRTTCRLAIVGVVCIVTLLVAGAVQSMHVCGLQLSSLGVSSEISSPATGNGPCLTCLMLHSTSAAVAILWLTFSLAFAFSCTAPGEHPRSLWEGLRLYVRPPPAL